MTRIIGIIITLFLLCACSKGTPTPAPATRPALLSAAEFTKEFAQAMQAKLPSVKVQVVGDLELKIVRPDDTSFQNFLFNAYADYKNDPAAKADLFERYLKPTMELAAVKKPTTLDPAHITPVVKDRAWLAETNRALQARGATKPLDCYVEDLNPTLIVMFVEDSEANLRYLNQKEIEAANVPIENVRALACENMKKLIPKIERRGSNGFYMVTAGGNYEASLLLLDIWDKGQFSVKGDIVVSIPARDILFVTGSDDPENLAKLREASKKSYDQGSYALTTALFLRQNGKWVDFNP